MIGRFASEVSGRKWEGGKIFPLLSSSHLVRSLKCCIFQRFKAFLLLPQFSFAKKEYKIPLFSHKRKKKGVDFSVRKRYNNDNATYWHCPQGGVIDMLNLTKRQLQISKRILVGEENVTARSLSDIYRVSTRAIRYDLDAIEYYLKKHNLEIIKNRASGIKVEGSEKNRKSLLATIESEDTSINFPCVIAIELLLKSTSTVMNLADELQVSRNKIIQSLPEAEKILATAGLSIEKRPAVGISIRGTENQIRMAKFKLNPLISTDLETYFSKRLSCYNEGKITNAITSYQSTSGVGFSDQGVKELVLTLCYQQLRIGQGYSITYDCDEKKEAIMCEDFELIRTCFQKEGLDLTVEEAIFAFHQIRNTQVIHLPDSRKGKVVHGDVMQLAKDFAMLVSERLGVDFVGNVSFLNGLKLHLNVVLHRMRTGQVIKNPLTESIKYKYRFIFETCKQIIMQLEQDYDLNFPDDEIAYIAMHVGACFEMARGAGLMPKALVVCNSGLATSNLLATRLKVMLPELSILGPMALSELELTPELVSEVDFVISTIPFSPIEKDLIIVDPLLGLDDVLALKNRVINITSEKQLSYLMLDMPADALKLGDLLSADHLKLQKRITSWRTAIEVAASSLIASGFISENYVKAMVEAVETFGPYMAFIPEIAVVHASPNAGVLKEGLSILTLEKPLKLGDTGGVFVTCFVVLATAEKESRLFMSLVSLLDNKSNVERLLNSSSKQEVLRITNE